MTRCCEVSQQIHAGADFANMAKEIGKILQFSKTRDAGAHLNAKLSTYDED
jgi:hypothetical protein